MTSLGLFAKLLNEFVFRGSYFLLASRGHESMLVMGKESMLVMGEESMLVMGNESRSKRA